MDLFVEVGHQVFSCINQKRFLLYFDLIEWGSFCFARGILLYSPVTLLKLFAECMPVAVKVNKNIAIFFCRISL